MVVVTTRFGSYSVLEGLELVPDIEEFSKELLAYRDCVYCLTGVQHKRISRINFGEVGYR